MHREGIKRQAAILLSVGFVSCTGCGRDASVPIVHSPTRTPAIVSVRAANEESADRFTHAALALAAFNLPNDSADAELAAGLILGDPSAISNSSQFFQPCADIVAPFDKLTLLDVAALVAAELAFEPFTSNRDLARAIATLTSSVPLDDEAISRVPSAETPCSDPEPTPSPTSVRSAVGEPIAFSCADSEASIRVRNGPRVTFDRTSIYIGYQQVSSNNQDPRLARFDNGRQTWCRDDYEVTGDDSQGYGLIWDGDRHFYAVFSATGSQGESSEDFREFARDGWLSSYGRGGGPKVAVIARIDPDTGDVERASFLTAQLSNGNSNTVVVKELDFSSNELTVRADSFYSPRRSDRTPFNCDGASPFDYSISFSTSLQNAIRANVRNTDTSSCR
ncbi:MAG: hypothetical protein AAFY57_12190 [Cyanobacteria bacterium J06642_2]